MMIMMMSEDDDDFEDNLAIAFNLNFIVIIKCNF
jgi:hypothetical protein